MRTGGVRLPDDRLLRDRALRWLAQRDHSRLELRSKLLRAATLAPLGTSRHGNAAPVHRNDTAAVDDADRNSHTTDAADIARMVDQLLDQLESSGYLDDGRFAEGRVRTRAERNGATRIVQELRRHGIRLETDATQALRESELARATRLWRRRFGDAPPADLAARARQARYLSARGFSADTIRRVIAALRDGTD